jgi:hypothetical protein
MNWSLWFHCLRAPPDFLSSPVRALPRHNGGGGAPSKRPKPAVSEQAEHGGQGEKKSMMNLVYLVILSNFSTLYYIHTTTPE